MSRWWRVGACAVVGLGLVPTALAYKEVAPPLLGNWICGGEGFIL